MSRKKNKNNPPPATPPGHPYPPIQQSHQQSHQHHPYPNQMALTQTLPQWNVPSPVHQNYPTVQPASYPNNFYSYGTGAPVINYSQNQQPQPFIQATSPAFQYNSNTPLLMPSHAQAGAFSYPQIIPQPTHHMPFPHQMNQNVHPYHAMPQNPSPPVAMPYHTDPNVYMGSVLFPYPSHQQNSTVSHEMPPTMHYNLGPTTEPAIIGHKVQNAKEMSKGMEDGAAIMSSASRSSTKERTARIREQHKQSKKQVDGHSSSSGEVRIHKLCLLFPMTCL